MKTLQRYIGTEIFRSVFYVLLFFVALWGFFDLTTELKSVGQGEYKFQHALLYIALGVPTNIYLFMPIGVLIGTILTLVQFAARSEFTIMRASSMSTSMIGWALFKIGIVYVLATFLFGELISPVTSEMADHLRAEKLGSSGGQQFRSGLWSKDKVKSKGVDGEVIGSRVINVRDLKNGEMKSVKVYEFDRDFHMTSTVVAARGEYQGGNVWRLIDVVETRFDNDVLNTNVSSQDVKTAVTINRLATKDLVSEITPQILSVSLTDPDNMPAYRLANYIAHLTENNEKTEIYEIGFWKKIINPFVSLVMMALALPFAYLHTRAGGTSFKAFIGIMIGVSFVLVDRLFSYWGQLSTWPPFLIAILPSMLYLLSAVIMLRWVERH